MRVKLPPLCFTMALLLLLMRPAVQAEAPAPVVHNRVVLITLDGMPARALDDPRVPMPNLRRMMQEGARATAMVPINPTVTWPNHTTLITGVNASVHHVMANGLIVPSAGSEGMAVKPWVPKEQLVHATTLYDAAAAAGLTTGQVDWVAIYGAKNVTWEFGEKPDASGPIARDLIAAGTVTENEVQQFGEKSSPAWRDEIWTDAAVDIITKHKPDLMLVHLLQTDTLQHEYGALSSAAYAAYGYADGCVGRIVDAVRAAGVLDQTTFIVTADHGFSSYTHVIRPRVVLAHMGQGAPAGVRVLSEGGSAEIFASPETARSPAFQAYAKALAATPGVSNVALADAMPALGLPVPGSTDQAPALYVSAAHSYAFSGDTRGDVVEDGPVRGAHGYLNSDPEMQAIFVASGAHVRKGVVLPTFNNLRVAPTIAKILGIQLPTEAPALTDMLQ